MVGRSGRGSLLPGRLEFLGVGKGRIIKPGQERGSANERVPAFKYAPPSRTVDDLITPERGQGCLEAEPYRIENRPGNGSTGEGRVFRIGGRGPEAMT